eukprot:PITA_19098
MAMESCIEEEQVKLLGWPRSRFVARVRITLALKGIQYEFIEEDAENKSQLLLQSNPVHKKVPVLIHNGKIVCESMIIVQYIDETWDKAPNLIAKDPYDRAIARFWAAFVDYKLLLSIWGVLVGQGEKQQKVVEESLSNFLLLDDALRASSCSGNTYFGGVEIGFTDIALGGLLVPIKAIQKVTNTVLVDPKKMPHLCAWTDRFSEIDSESNFARSGQGIGTCIVPESQIYVPNCWKLGKII